MKTTIKATKMELTDAIRANIDEKFGSLNKYFDQILEADIEVGITSNHHQKGQIFFAEVNLSVPGKLIRARQEKDDLYVAINEVKTILKRELQDYKEKLRGK